MLLFFVSFFLLNACARMSASNIRIWGTHVLKLFREKKNNMLTSESAQVLFTWCWIYWKMKIKSRTIWRRLKLNSIYLGVREKKNFNGSFECVMWSCLPEKTTIYWSNIEKKNKTFTKHFCDKVSGLSRSCLIHTVTNKRDMHFILGGKNQIICVCVFFFGSYSIMWKYVRAFGHDPK